MERGEIEEQEEFFFFWGGFSEALLRQRKDSWSWVEGRKMGSR